MELAQARPGSTGRDRPSPHGAGPGPPWLYGRRQTISPMVLAQARSGSTGRDRHSPPWCWPRPALALREETDPLPHGAGPGPPWLYVRRQTISPMVLAQARSGSTGRDRPSLPWCWPRPALALRGETDPLPHGAGPGPLWLYGRRQNISPHGAGPGPLWLYGERQTLSPMVLAQARPGSTGRDRPSPPWCWPRPALALREETGHLPHGAGPGPLWLYGRRQTISPMELAQARSGSTGGDRPSPPWCWPRPALALRGETDPLPHGAGQARPGSAGRDRPSPPWCWPRPALALREETDPLPHGAGPGPPWLYGERQTLSPWSWPRPALALREEVRPLPLPMELTQSCAALCPRLMIFGC